MSMQMSDIIRTVSDEVTQVHEATKKFKTTLSVVRLDSGSIH